MAVPHASGVAALYLEANPVRTRFLHVTFAADGKCVHAAYHPGVLLCLPKCAFLAELHVQVTIFGMLNLIRVHEG